MNKVSVIIPARNEEKTIGQVIDIVKKSKVDHEIIVVNNASIDNTADIAKEKGVRVVNCDKVGKGNAMKVGLESAINEFVVFLDSDIVNYNERIVEILVEPLIKRNVDFVKSAFDRTTGGVVTEVATKPLLELLFPDMPKFIEPLSGMIAGKKSILETLDFEPDYGVDIGILIDVINKNVKVEEVNIGQIINMSHVLKTNETMKNKSIQIMRAILKRYNR